MPEMTGDGIGFVDRSVGEPFAFEQSGPYVWGTARSYDPPVPGRERLPARFQAVFQRQTQTRGSGPRALFFSLVYKNKTLLLRKK